MTQTQSTISPSLIRDERSLLAWAGWQLDVPADWRPLKLMGDHEKGSMIVGDSDCALFSIHWEHADSGALLNGEQWVADRLKSQGVLSHGTPPASENFTACGWAKGLQTEEDKQTTYWYGYAAQAELLLGAKINGVLPEAQLDYLLTQVLPTLRSSPLSAESAWAMHEISFFAPPGFIQNQRHLYAGDVAIEFHKGRQETLLLRQIYPGELALGRRSFEEWLASYPFKEHRRLRKTELTKEPWQSASRRELIGFKRHGRKRLGFPLGFCAPRWTDALAVHDQRLDRLLIAEHMSTAEPDGSICQTAIVRMNASLREGR